MTTWTCGKCQGANVPEHHRTCPHRTTPPPRLAGPLRRALRRVLNAMTTGGAPVAWPADPVTMTTEQARLALGLGTDADPNTPWRLGGAVLHHPMLRADLGESRHLLVNGRDALRTTLADLEDTRRQLRRAEAAVTRLQAQGEVLERKNATLTRDVALRTTQRDRARSSLERAFADRDRLQVERDALRRILDAVVSGADPATVWALGLPEQEQAIRAAREATRKADPC